MILKAFIPEVRDYNVWMHARCYLILCIICKQCLRMQELGLRLLLYLVK